MKGNTKMKQKIKLGIILGIEFVAITVILILIFFAGKKTYKVTFDLNGGTLISGDLVQNVPQGKNATPPTVAKDGCYLRSWSASYKQVTHDIVVKAVWEWEIITTVGFKYSSSEDKDYCTIESSFEDLYGDIYVPVHNGDKKILGIDKEAFISRKGITNVHMLDGIISIGNKAFAECDELVSVELPGTLKKLGEGVFKECPKLTAIVLPSELEAIPKDAFKDCTSLEEVVISSSVKSIGENAFENCIALEEIVIPASVKSISANAFAGCTSLKKVVFETEEVTEVDEETEDVVVIGYKGIEHIAAGAFADCELLTEIVLPDTIKSIDAFAFNNPELIIYLPFKEEDTPEEFEENWHGESLVKWIDTVLEPDEEPDEEIDELS